MAAIALVKKLEDNGEKRANKKRNNESLFATEEESRKMAKIFLASLPKDIELILNSEEDNPLTIEAIKFANKYKKRNYGAPALIRFLCNYCHVQLTVLFGSAKSKIGIIRRNI